MGVEGRGDRIRWAREQRRLSQADVAAACGHARTTQVRWETDDATHIPKAKGERLAAVLNVDWEWLQHGGERLYAPAETRTDQQGAQALILQSVSLLTQALHLLQAGASAASAVEAVERAQGKGRTTGPARGRG